MSILDLLKDESADWTRQRPADEAAVQKLVKDSGLDLPDTYLTLLRYSNGGGGPLCLEGEFKFKPRWFELWQVEEVIDLNMGSGVKEWLPDFFGFGSNGGGEMFAFNTGTQQPWRIYAIPFTSMEECDAWLVAESIEAFIRGMGHDIDGSDV